MPHTRSAKKSLRQIAKRRASNRAVVKAVKTQIKRVQVAADGSVEDLRKECSLAARRLDKAAAKRVIHPNLAARKKAQLAHLLHEKEAAAKTAPT